MSLFESASLVVTPNGTKASKLYAVKPTDGAGDLTVTRATTARRYNSAGLIEIVASNVPRLDYSNGTCPSILVEQQRTNISNYIESGTGNFQSGGVTSGTSILSLTTFKVTTNTGTYGDAPFLNANSEYQANTPYTISFYTDFSKCTGTEISASFLGFFPTFAYAGINVNKTTKAITTFNVNGVWTLNNYSAIQIDGEIYRITCTATPNALSLGGSRNYISTTNTFDIEVAGLQLEAGNYPTSFISKSTSASVTRNADVISKTGISSLIGQTEGTIYLECEADITNSNGAILVYLGSSDGSGAFDYSTYIKFNSNNLNLTVYSGGVLYVNSNSTETYTNKQKIKLAFCYKNNDFICYANGIQLFTDTSGTVSTNLSSIALGHYPPNIPFNQYNGSFKNINVWKTRLSNSELATLTTI